MLTKRRVNEIGYNVIGAAIEVHKIMGCGLLESVYHKCMQKELLLRGINFTSELKIPLNYKETKLLASLRCDLYVENCILLEIKSVIAYHPVFASQILT